MSPTPATSRPFLSAPHFTPGCWVRVGHRHINTASGLPVCEVLSGAVGIEQADANEHLIAAAPDLFIALQAALVVVAGCNADHAFDIEDRMIRSTLARALGVVRERWTPALFLTNKRVMLLATVGSEPAAIERAEAAASVRRDVEWVAAQRTMSRTRAGQQTNDNSERGAV